MPEDFLLLHDVVAIDDEDGLLDVDFFKIFVFQKLYFVISGRLFILLVFILLFHPIVYYFIEPAIYQLHNELLLSNLLHYPYKA